jgi:hypothetical protein
MTSTTTATALTHSTAPEMGHDAHPTQRQDHPVATACSSVRLTRRLLVLGPPTSLADGGRICDPVWAKDR